VGRKAEKEKAAAKKTSAAGRQKIRAKAPEAPLAEVGEESRLLAEVAAIVTLTVSVFSALSFVAYQGGSDSLNLAGKVGELLADGLLQALGFAAYLGPIFLGSVGLLLFRQASGEISFARAAGALVIILCTAILLGLVASPSRPLIFSGGWIGGFIAEVLRQAFGTPGAFLMVGSMMVLSFVFVTRVSLGRVMAVTAAGTGKALRRAAAAASRPAIEAARDVVAPLPRANLKREAPPDEEAISTGPLIVRPDLASKLNAKRRATPVQEELPFADDGRYQLPPLRFLRQSSSAGLEIDEEALHKSSQILETKLADFGIEARVVEVRPGPVITTFDVEPAAGVKVNRIVSLGDDLSMALRVSGVRILAPVPGKAVVGIEVANPGRDVVALREMLESDLFVRSRSLLTLALGKDTAGQSRFGDLAKMPHLMVAGATGSGKSVAVNSMIMSILYKAAPRDVRFVMIDMKMLELSVYEDIPHLLVPVVTDPKVSVAVLNNIVELMEERYRLMKMRGVRNIDGYNRFIDDDAPQEGAVVELQELADDDDEEEVVTASPNPERLPKIVVIIDELADLMMTMGRKVEEPITRLAQKARAAGIHLILATQRPSVDVITGLIKANFPSRISFKTTARVDSRTILDSIGAERLLGKGDMLYMPPGSSVLERLHGPLLTEEEIHKVVAFIKRQGSPQYAFSLLEAPEEEDDQAFEDDLSDELYDQAVRLVTESRQASISWVQRRLRVGYNRAARMVERMEREGVISASDGGRPREVLAPAMEAE
jgi:S-DNA-T family DNA segregation ATPase FtsK/SpoIIIE